MYVSHDSYFARYARGETPASPFGKRVVPLPQNGNDQGVTPHSGDGLWKPYVIFAIDAASNGKDPQQQTLGVMQFKLWCAERGLGVKEMLGCYNGQREPVFIMAEERFYSAGVPNSWCSRQESFMRLSATRAPGDPEFPGFRIAELVYNLGLRRPNKVLGRYHRVNTTEAMDRDCWTYDPEGVDGSGGFWVAGDGGRFGTAASREAIPDPHAPAQDPRT